MHLFRRPFPRPEGLLGAAAATVGLISIVSALTPSLASRSDLIDGLLPPQVTEGARVGAFLFGAALIWVSRSLAGRRQRAWQAAVVLVIGSAVAHLLKGLDAEEALASAFLLGALLRYRDRFDVPGDRTATPQLLLTACPLAAAGIFLVLYAGDHLSAREDVEDVAAAAAVLLVFRALYLWLRPLRERVTQSVGQRRRARALIVSHGRDSLAFFALRRDKNYFFAADGSAFLAYRVVAGTALVSGDPIGDSRTFGGLVEDFRRAARARGWRIAILGASAAQLPLYRSFGFRALQVGEEAIVHPGTFTLDGRPIRKVRQSVNRLLRGGYHVRILRAPEVDEVLRAELEELSDEWRGRSPERGFTMGMDGFFANPEPVFAVAVGPNGRPDGFLHLVPSPAGQSYSLSAMRRRRTSPNGLMEFLVAETIAWAKAEDVPELSLNFCAFSDILRATSDSKVRAALRFCLLPLDRLFQLRRLLVFNRKFFPEWRPRFLLCERLSDFPLAGLAFLRAESLLTPPGPWTRGRGRGALLPGA